MVYLSIFTFDIYEFMYMYISLFAYRYQNVYALH